MSLPFKEKCHCSRKFPKSTLTLPNTTGKMFCELVKLRLSCLEKNTQGYEKGTVYNIKTSSQQWSTGGGSIMIWGWTACCHPRQVYQGVLRIVSGCVSWSSIKDGWCSRTVTLNIKVKTVCTLRSEHAFIHILGQMHKQCVHTKTMHTSECIFKHMRLCWPDEFWSCFFCLNGTFQFFILDFTVNDSVNCWYYCH